MNNDMQDPIDREPEDVEGKEFEKQVQTELNVQFMELKDQARSLLSAVKGRRGVKTQEDWDEVLCKARTNNDSGRFIIERLGAERFIEPELMATLSLLRTDLLADIERPTAADRMMADTAVLAYYNLLRVQGWVGNLALAVERQLFGQESLTSIHGQYAAERLENDIRRLEDRMMPLIDRAHRMMVRSLRELRATPTKPSSQVSVGRVEQVNVGSVVQNN